MKHTVIAAALAAAMVLSACSDSTAPAAIQLTDAQAEDLMEALASVGSPTGLSRRSAEYRQGLSTQLATITIDESEPCPNGGTRRTQGTFNINDAGTQATADFTHGYTNCQATSPNNVLWTFNGAPNVAFDFSMTFNEATEEYSMSGTQKGAVDASSSLGSGRCVIDLTYSATGNAEAGTVTVSGSVCGRTISVTVTE